MESFSFVCVILALMVNVSNGGLCGKDDVKYSNESTNCTNLQFEPLCTGPVHCHDHDNDNNLIIARSVNEEGEETLCEFERILEGNDFVKCDVEILQSNYFRCFTNQTLIVSRGSFCDGNTCNDCPGHSDLASGTGFKCLDLQKPCLVPQPLLYDNKQDCRTGEDLCFTLEDQRLIHFNESLRNILEPKQTCFRCKSGSMLISRRSLCDGIVDCDDLSDECLYCQSSDLCNRVVFSPPDFDSQCSIGDLKCGDGTCINRSQVCDGEQDCVSQIDERTEHCGITLPCSQTTLSQQCRCDDGCNYLIGKICGDPTCYNKSTLSSLDQTCVSAIPDEPLFCSEKNEAYVGTICDGIAQCETTLDDEVSCGRFVCKSLSISVYSVLNASVCDFQDDCEDGSDELNCTNRFYCHSGDVPYVRLNQVKNGRADCLDASDECVENGENNAYAFHSQSQLLGNRVLYGVVWLMAFFAISGNLVVIVQQVRILRKIQFNAMKLSSLRANHILILSLAVADLLMGIYLVAVGVAYERLKGSYCQRELVWRSSNVCTWMGVTMLVSSQTSVLTIVALTSLRLYAILKPFKTSSRPPTWLVSVLALGAWLVSIIISILPLTGALRGYLPDTALLTDNPLMEGIFSFNDGKDLLIRSLKYYPPSSEAGFNQLLLSQAQAAVTWDELIAIKNMLSFGRNDLNVVARFGFYNIHSICIADFFPRFSDHYVALSAFLIIFNFVAFVYIAVVYVAIYRMSFKNAATSVDRSDAARMQAKIFRLIITDFLSWVPVCILAFIRLGDTEENLIGGNVYAVAAIVLLPINSALNPLVYSNVIPRVCKIIDFVHTFKSMGKEEKTTATIGTRSTAGRLQPTYVF